MSRKNLIRSSSYFPLQVLLAFRENDHFFTCIPGIALLMPERIASPVESPREEEEIHVGSVTVPLYVDHLSASYPVDRLYRVRDELPHSDGFFDIAMLAEGPVRGGGEPFIGLYSLAGHENAYGPLGRAIR